MKHSFVITGASTGIGLACARRLAHRRFRVFAGVRSDASAEDLKRQHVDIVPIRLDVTKLDTIESAVHQVGREVSDTGLRGLVNNAGIGIGGPLEVLPVEDLRRQFEVNVFGPHQVTQAFLPLLRQGKGRIVNMSSIGGRVAQPFLGPYAASKFALEALSDALRGELARWGLQVSIIEPGAIETPIWNKASTTADALKQKLSEEMLECYGHTIERVQARLVRTGTSASSPERVADAVEHALLSPRPRTRYLVGTDAKIAATLRWLLPDRAFFWLLRRA